MRKKRWLYLLSCFLLIVLFVITGAYYLLVFAAVMIWMMLISYLLMRIFYKKICFQFSDNEELQVFYHSKFLLPMGRVKISIKLVNQFFETMEYSEHCFLTPLFARRIPLSFNFRRIGNTVIEIVDCELNDMLGLFRVKLSPEVKLEKCPMPFIHRQSELPEMSFQDQQLIISLMNRQKSEDYEIREYRQGDSLKDVHYKLSYKLDELMVKDKYQNTFMDVDLLLDLSGSEAECEAVLMRGDCCIRYMLTKGASCHLFWYSKQELCDEMINRMEDVDALYSMILHAPKASVATMAAFDGMILTAQKEGDHHA